MNGPQVGVVVIGRNEGRRLRLCLQSLIKHDAIVVYVDSGSTDGSPADARAVGADVVELDMSIPFSAARARNAGFERLMSRRPNTEFVQFVDGDCEMFDDWLATASGILSSRDELAVAAGRLHERHRDATVYNRLCDIEWDLPLGEVQECGGIFMIRASTFNDVGGFNIQLVAGEEPDLCFRLRTAGWIVWRHDGDMAWHDAAISHFGQWCKRSVRTGYAFADVAWRHLRSPGRFSLRPVISILLWALVIPLMAVIPVWWTYGFSLLLLLLYPVQVWRIARRQIRDGRDSADSWVNARFMVLGKFPQLIGVFRFFRKRLLRQQSTIIEHKDSAPTGSA
ncbi:MAG: glycosyl transferase [Planctomycetaceae bacterium]|nr:glycosyl transferase [Planctomycetaceae bacterium]